MSEAKEVVDGAAKEVVDGGAKAMVDGAMVDGGAKEVVDGGAKEVVDGGAKEVVEAVVDGAKVDGAMVDGRACVIAAGGGGELVGAVLNVSLKDIDARLARLIENGRCWMRNVESSIATVEGKTQMAHERAEHAVELGEQAWKQSVECEKEVSELVERLDKLERMVQGGLAGRARRAGRAGQAGQSDQCKYGPKCHNPACTYTGTGHPDRKGRVANWVADKGKAIAAEVETDGSVKGTCACGRVWIQRGDYLHQKCSKDCAGAKK